MDPERAARSRDQKESPTTGELHLMSDLLDRQDAEAFEANGCAATCPKETTFQAEHVCSLPPCPR